MMTIDKLLIFYYNFYVGVQRDRDRARTQGHRGRVPAEDDAEA